MSQGFFFRWVVVLSAVVFGLQAFASDGSKAGDETYKKWLKFQSNPHLFLQSNPEKVDQAGQPVPEAMDSVFNRDEISSREYVTKKVKTRNKTFPVSETSGSQKTGSRFLAPIREKIEDFLDSDEFRNKGLSIVFSLQEMDQRRLNSGHLDNAPWSGPYWPIYQGNIGTRYASDTYVELDNEWGVYHDFVTKKAPLASIYSSGDADEIDQLSPSEKYDLLIGDLTVAGAKFENGYLTPNLWSEGAQYMSTMGKVETWMGICHGWAAAAFMVPRPVRAVTSQASDGKTPLKFYPSDIKGLTSYLWANVNMQSTFIGSRCNEKKPKVDPESGRLIKEGCFDTNPAIWHLAVVNQIGQAKRSFVLDATYDYEVWNQPVVSYSYRYFNPQTGQSAASLEAATVHKADFSNDKFKKFRSSQAVSYVGVEMRVTYVMETHPSHLEADSPEMDAVRTVTYMYDLELNDRGEIAGGEWYNNNHPDFLWLPSWKYQAKSYGDSVLEQNPTGGWTPDQPLPKFWKDIAVVTAVRYRQPVAAILDAIVAQASSSQE